MSGSTIPMDFAQPTIEIARTSVGEGGLPFGTVVVKDGEILAEGRNLVPQTHDPTDHAEILTIREGVPKAGHGVPDRMHGLTRRFRTRGGDYQTWPGVRATVQSGLGDQRRRFSTKPPGGAPNDLPVSFDTSRNTQRR
jgi:hypothetical protein